MPSPTTPPTIPPSPTGPTSDTGVAPLPATGRVLFLVELEGSAEYERQYAATAAEAVAAAQRRGLPAVSAYRPDPAEVLLTLCDEVRAVRDEAAAQRAVLASACLFSRTAEAAAFRTKVEKGARASQWTSRYLLVFFVAWIVSSPAFWALIRLLEELFDSWFRV